MPIPIGVAFTIDVGVARGVGARRPTPRPCRRRARARPAAASGRRAATATSAPGAAQRDRDGARRAPGAEHEHRRAGHVVARSARTDRRKPSPSVESPRRPPSGNGVTVLTLRNAAGVGAQLVAGGGGRLLVRHRDRQPGEPERAHAVERGGRCAGRHLERDVHPVETELAIRGVVQDRRERMTDRITDDGRDPCRAGDHSTPFARAIAMFFLCCSQRVGERVVTLLVDHDVIEVVGRRRRHGRADRRFAHRRDRRRRQARCARTCCTAS